MLEQSIPTMVAMPGTWVVPNSTADEDLRID